VEYEAAGRGFGAGGAALAAADDGAFGKKDEVGIFFFAG
jgi:hypothetical protein